jgi:hypothetical protein
VFTQGLPSRLQAPVTKKFGTAFGAQAGGYRLLTLGYILNQYSVHIQGLSGQIQSYYFQSPSQGNTLFYLLRAESGKRKSAIACEVEVVSDVVSVADRVGLVVSSPGPCGEVD